MEYRKLSLQARILQKMLMDITSTNVLGKAIQRGELRQRVVESEWKCPKTHTLAKIQMPKFTMELLTTNSALSEQAILQLHGGGYIGPMKNQYRKFALQYSKITNGSAILTIDYRTAPEHVYPAALEDAVTSYNWLIKEGYQEENIVVVGDSAGGGLALALCLFLRDQKRKLPKKIITMSAWADLVNEGDSYKENYTKDPLFGNTKDSMIYNSSYIGHSDPRDPYISPIFGEFMGFPPMLMQVGTNEILLSDTLTIAQKAKRVGVHVTLSVYEQMYHVFQMAMNLLPESRKAWKEVEKFLLEQ